MKTNKLISVLFLIITFFCTGISSCTWDKPEVPDNSGITDSVENPVDTMNNPGFNCPGYPDDVKAIIVGKCATAGCHNAASYAGASGLNLTSWLTMRRGNSAGAVVIPGNPDYSTLFSFCNTYTDLGFTGNDPKMPLNNTALSRDEIITLKNWITDGARNRCGDLMFPDNSISSKVYISNQACDQVVAVDGETKLIRRWFDVGITPLTESPHMLRLSPDGQYLYVALYTGMVQRFKTYDDSFVDEVNTDITTATGIAGGGQWGTMVISPDGKMGYCVDYTNYRIAAINLQNFPMTSFTSNPIPMLGRPHGVMTNQAGNKLYITNQNGSFYSIIDTASTIAGFNNAVPNMQVLEMQGGLNGHDIIFSPDYSKYFISCDATHEVRVFQTSDNALLASINVGTLPQEFSISNTKPYLFVSCTEDIMPEGRGSIAVIDYNSLTLIKKIYSGTQPHGIAVDDEKGLVYVANRNVDNSGPAPHHSSACEGRNGYLTIIDLSTLELVPGYKCELGVNPYSVAFKK